MSNEKQKLLNEIDRFRRQYGESTESHGDIKNPHMQEHGQIFEMALPSDWVEGEPYLFKGGIGTRSFREVHPIDAPQAMLSFYYRGLPMSEQAGKTFHQLLASWPRTLSVKEIESVGDVLRDKRNAEDFAIYYAQTEDWNGKMVLCVEGRYKEVQEDVFEIFVDASGDGRVVQEIYFQAPKDSFAKFAKAAKESMRSIVWK